jgi:thiamine-phosphate pyrophosphorylase
MPLDSAQRPPVMCLTHDGLPLSPVAQAEQLCAAGARWIQLRMKSAAPEAWLSTARAVVAVCRAHEARCIINDSVAIALAAGADGVHLGSSDLAWRAARNQLGPRKILGGTVNNLADATRARAAGCLDYVGIGPLRFTATKQKLAPVLGLAGITALLPTLGELPAWAIGGVQPGDLPALRHAGVAGVAVSSSLFSNHSVSANYAAFATAWSPTASVTTASAF